MQHSAAQQPPHKHWHFMKQNATIAINRLAARELSLKALAQGDTMNAPTATSPEMATLVADRTLDKYAKDYFPRREQVTISFRGDIAEKHSYDKIRPLSEAQRHDKNIVVIEGLSQKKGTTALYRIECNSWNLIEAVGLWEQPA